MKFTLSWLKRHLETETDAAALAERLTALGVEVEGVEDRAPALAPFRVGYVVEASGIPMPTAFPSVWSRRALASCRWFVARRTPAPA